MGRIIFTGGSGKAGRYVIPELLKHGHEILNLDLQPLDKTQSEVYTLKTDLTNPGQVFNALCGQFKLMSPNPAGTPPIPDAVIHFAGVPRNMLCTDDETFRINTLSAYNVVDAACKLGVKKIILASSGCVYGVTFASGDVNYDSYPTDEETDVNPMDTYAISKVCIERIARGCARRFGIDIYCFRIANVIEPHEYAEENGIFHQYVYQPERFKISAWSYTDARDLGNMCQRAIETSGLGFQIFNATNDTITNLTPTMQFLKERGENVPFTRELDEYEAPRSNAKMKRMLGFQEEHNWRKYFPFKEQGL